MSKITPIKFNKNFTPVNFKLNGVSCPVFKTFKDFKASISSDLIQFQEINFSPLIQRKIARKNQNPEDFFEEISSKIFADNKNLNDLKKLLLEGYISLSTSCYNGLLNSGKLNSAVGIKLDKNKNTTRHLALLEQYIRDGVGTGINFTEFDNPTEKIKDINSYFLFRQKENDLTRPPAGIALLSINHPKILDFITLKNDASFDEWCFDLSVIIPDDFLKKVDNDEYISLLNGKKIKAKEFYSMLLNSMLKKGEPGIIFSNDENYICDCCAAVPLKPEEGLTLAHINLSKFYDNKKKTLNYEKLSQVADLLSKALSKLDQNGYIGILGYQDLLDKMNIEYGSKNAIEILESMLKMIKKQVSLYNLKMAISPTGTISRILKVAPSIEPKEGGNYEAELETLKVAQKYMDGNISKTILLNSNATTDDIDMIIRKSFEYKIRGITVFKPQ